MMKPWILIALGALMTALARAEFSPARPSRAEILLAESAPLLVNPADAARTPAPEPVTQVVRR